MLNQKRKIVVVTGTRAEYGILKPVLKEIKKNQKLDLYLIVSGMHLEKKFGYSIKEIIKDGFKIAGTVRMTPQGNTGYDMSIALSKGIEGFSKLFKKIKPDFNVILGDRGEAFGAAIAAMHMNIINVHIHGGESSKGGIDEYMRHAITKISNIHFAATKQSGLRIKKMGENKKFIYITGSPAMDDILQNYSDKSLVLKKYDIHEGYALLVQHPVTTQTKHSRIQIKITLDILTELKKETIIIGPNSDAGHLEILETINQYIVKHKFLKYYSNLPRIEYLSLLKYCDFIIGNSSSAIIDAPSFKKAAINIGIRQLGRETANNVINVNHKRSSIMNAIKLTSNPAFKKLLKNCINPYGDGNASVRIVKILSSIKITDELIQKKIVY